MSNRRRREKKRKRAAAVAGSSPLDRINWDRVVAVDFGDGLEWLDEFEDGFEDEPCPRVNPRLTSAGNLGFEDEPCPRVTSVVQNLVSSFYPPCECCDCSVLLTPSEVSAIYDVALPSGSAAFGWRLCRTPEGDVFMGVNYGTQEVRFWGPIAASDFAFSAMSELFRESGLDPIDLGGSDGLPQDCA